MLSQSTTLVQTEISQQLLNKLPRHSGLISPDRNWMNYFNFGDSLTFPLASLPGQNMYLYATFFQVLQKIPISLNCVLCVLLINMY